MAYDPAVIRAIKRIGRKRHEPGRYITGELATGIVESGLKNLPGGDADSYGFRQQRQGIYGRQSLSKQINNLYDEMHQFDKGQSLGELLADVQRPAAQYRGRYAQVLDQARKLAGGDVDLSGMGTVGAPAATGGAAPSQQGNIFQTLMQLNASQATQSPQAAQLQRGWQLLSGLNSQQSSPDTSVQGMPQGPSEPAAGGPKGSGLMELFFDPVGGWKNGQSIGAIGGHADHVHVGANPRRLRYIANKVASGKFGRLENREFAPYDKVDPVHTKNSLHYKGEADDVSGDPHAERRFVSWLRRKYGLQ